MFHTKDTVLKPKWRSICKFLGAATIFCFALGLVLIAAA